MFSEGASARFLREARTVARLTHPNIVTLYDAGRQDHWHYLVLELVVGSDLRTLMIQQGVPFQSDEVLHLARGVLGGLAYAHEQGVIHRDIKPGNIMITLDSQVKVMDFGLALSHDEVRLTQPGTILGTVLYMAPELLKGKEANERTDLYAVGAVLYELLSGQPLFEGENIVAVASQILNATPVALRSLNPIITPELEQIISRLLEKDPAQTGS
jgi:serine/threonine protein kinase